MLVLKLKAGDRIAIGDDVFLDCKAATSGVLRLAISAPENRNINLQKIERASEPVRELPESYHL